MPPTATGGDDAMERWTRLMIRYRWAVVAAWLVVLVAGGWSSSKLSDLLSNTFTMPGTDSERARTILNEHYGERSDGTFTVVFRVPSASDPALRRRLQADVVQAAKEVPTGQARPLVPGGARLRSRLAPLNARRLPGPCLLHCPQRRRPPSDAPRTRGVAEGRG